MTLINTTEIKNGSKLLIDGNPCSVIKTEMVKPGKGQAFNRVKYRNLVNGRVLEKTFKSSEKVTQADVNEVDLQYLYADDKNFYFMEPTTFEQYQVSNFVVGDNAKWLVEEAICMVTLFDGVSISVELPSQVVQTVVDTDPGVKGDTSGSGGKPATLDRGAVVNVPLFVQIGDKIIVNTQTSEYISRVKN